MSEKRGLTRLILRLGRNPDAGYPEGADDYGYVVNAPLDQSGKLDPALWRETKALCTVRRFHPKEAPADGWLRHRGDNWYFWYDEADEGPEEPGFKLGAHELRAGEYVTIREGDGDVLTFRIAEATPA
ncbi:MAG: hypothetical protein K2P70_00845 [Hyphomonadaceae bacterium]|nr:hypothetical protein [Hyphomonadaceae bacterium]